MPMSRTGGSEVLNVLIVGCGNIAGGFDRVGADTVLTHAGAYRRHGGFRLAACVDPDPGRRGAFKERWGVERAYSSLAEALTDAARYDVVSICSPTARHASDLRELLVAAPRLVFCEKPVTTDIGDAAAMVAAYRRAGILMAVNHTRRWDREVSDFKLALERGEWGPVRSAVGFYNKGVLNNGSHMVDLLQHLLGKLELKAIGAMQLDHAADDPTVAALLSAANAIPVHLATGMAGDYALFELQLVTAKGVVAIEQGGFRWRERLSQESSQFAGYRIVSDGTQRAGGYAEAMLRAATNIHDALTKGAELASTGESALAAQSVCDKIRQHALATAKH